MEEFVIIGGGLAGLCAAIRLTELGARPLLIEAGSYPAHKVCGEFLSPEIIPTLTRLGVSPISLTYTRLHAASTCLSFSFPTPAGSLSHFSLDKQLADQAQAQGAMIYTQTRVQQLIPKTTTHSVHEITLHDGNQIQARHLLIATGRIPGMHARTFEPTYLGIKAHFQDIPMEQCLEMFSLPGAYLGIVPIENGHYNVAGLIKKVIANRFKTPALLMEFMAQSHPLLEAYLSRGKMLFPEWMHTDVPHFGIKSTPTWKDTYFMGDAIGTIPPACGGGLALAISSGYLAAEYARASKYEEYQKNWLKHFGSPIKWGKGLHAIFLRPSWIEAGLKLVKQMPSLAQWIFNLTRQNLM